MVFRFSLLSMVLFFSLALSPLAKIPYLWDQIWYGLELVWNRKTVEEVLEDPELNQLYGEKLKWVAEVKSFAGSYGLNVSSSYNTMVFPPGDPKVVSYLVIASEKLSLTPVTYWFPFAGRVPYLGFFEKEDRDQKVSELQSEGYDVFPTAAGAFSLLGYLEDPIFPSMLARSLPTLTATLIHELVHATFWLSGSTTFNEHLAEFISLQLTPEFLKEHASSEELQKFLNKKDDDKLFHHWLKDLKERLEKLYERSDLTPETMLEQKHLIFKDAVEYKPDFKGYDLVGERVEAWNNARIVLSSVYSPDFTEFTQALQCVPGSTLQEKIPAFLKHLKEYSSPLTISQVSAKICSLSL